MGGEREVFFHLRVNDLDEEGLLGSVSRQDDQSLLPTGQRLTGKVERAVSH